MTRKLEDMAREAGLAEFGGCTEANLARFAALVRADALEQAAKLVQRYDTNGDHTQGWQDIFAELIRALGEQQ